MKGLFILDVTVKMFRNASVEGVADFYERAGYNRALRDCGVLEDDSN